MNSNKKIKAQSAMEYLMTYGWAILVIALILGVLYALGVFSPSSLAHNECVFPAGYSCLSTTLHQNGNFTINLQQVTSSPINVTGVGCATNVSTAYIVKLPHPITIGIGDNYTFRSNSSFPLHCIDNGTIFARPIGNIFNGYVIINYTDLQTGFPGIVTATLVQKVD